MNKKGPQSLFFCQRSCYHEQCVLKTWRMPEMHMWPSSETGETLMVSQACFTQLSYKTLWVKAGGARDQHQSPSGRYGPRVRAGRPPDCGTDILDLATATAQMFSVALTGKASDKSLGVTADKSLKLLPGTCSGSEILDRSVQPICPAHGEAKTSF